MNTQEPVLNVRQIASGAVVSAALGAVAILVMGAVVGIEFWLSMILAFQMAVVFAIVGGWTVASFMFDDGLDGGTAKSQTAESHAKTLKMTPTLNGTRSKAA